MSTSKGITNARMQNLQRRIFGKENITDFFFTLNEENSRRRDKHCDGHFLNDKMFLAAYTSTFHRLRGVDVRAEFSRFGFVLQVKQNILANKKNTLLRKFFVTFQYGGITILVLNVLTEASQTTG